MLASLLEQVAHPCRADPDEHLDEFRTGDREERHPGLAGHRAGEQGLAGPRWADQQHALGRPAAEPPVFDRVLQKVDDLDQFLLGLVDPGDIGEGDPGFLFDIDLGAALADRHHAAEPALPEAPDREHPDPDEEDRRQHPRQQVADPVAFDDAAVDHAVLVETLRQIGGDPRGDEVLEPVGLCLFQRAADVILGDRDLGDLAVVEQGLEAAVGDRGPFRALKIKTLNPQHAENGGDHVPEIDVNLLVHLIHRFPTFFRVAAVAKSGPVGESRSRLLYPNWGIWRCGADWAQMVSDAAVSSALRAD